MEISTFFIALLLLMLVGLSVRVSFARRDARVSLGDGGDAAVLRLVRMHGNFVEYAPFGALLLWVLEYHLFAGWVLWLLGTLFVGARALHAYSLWHAQGPMWARFYGTILSHSVLGIGALLLLVYLARSLFNLY